MADRTLLFQLPFIFHSARRVHYFHLPSWSIVIFLTGRIATSRRCPKRRHSTEGRRRFWFRRRLYFSWSLLELLSAAEERVEIRGVGARQIFALSEFFVMHARFGGLWSFLHAATDDVDGFLNMRQSRFDQVADIIGYEPLLTKHHSPLSNQSVRHMSHNQPHWWEWLFHFQAPNGSCWERLKWN